MPEFRFGHTLCRLTGDGSQFTPFHWSLFFFDYRPACSRSRNVKASHALQVDFSRALNETAVDLKPEKACGDDTKTISRSWYFIGTKKGTQVFGGAPRDSLSDSLFRQ